MRLEVPAGDRRSFIDCRYRDKVETRAVGAVGAWVACSEEVLKA